MEHQFVVSKSDWSLHRKGHEDQQRHKEKIREAIRKNLPHIISEESIITSDGKHTVKIPIRSLNEYKIRYDDKKKNTSVPVTATAKLATSSQESLAMEAARVPKGANGPATSRASIIMKSKWKSVKLKKSCLKNLSCRM
jgi:Uncharacterized conserved protein